MLEDEYSIIRMANVKGGNFIILFNLFISK